VTLPEFFRRQGYHVAGVGKIEHRSQFDAAAWSEVLTSGVRPESPRERRAPPGTIRWEASDGPDDAEPDGATARAAAQFLNRPSREPFFLAVGFHKPHLPWVAPQRYFDLYRLKDIPLPQAAPDDLHDVPVPAANPPVAPNPQSAVEQREAIRAYFACVSFVDAQIGLLLDALHRTRHTEDTIVVLWSDHGFQLGEHAGQWAKNTLFEESVHVPLLIAAPGMPQPGTPAAAPVELLDLFPTLVDLCELPMPLGLQGVTLRPLLDDPRDAVKPAAVTLLDRGNLVGRSVRTVRYRYTEWGSPRRAELYDHVGDPQEHHNLARDHAVRSIVADHHRLLCRSIYACDVRDTPLSRGRFTVGRLGATRP
jgi:uncharacterized sulfatase